MGPNALPVQDLRNGQFQSELSILVAPEVHFAPNDFTSDLFLKVNIPIKNAVALQIWWVPIEFFTTDTIVRDYRKARTRSAEGYAIGDVYIGTVIPLVQNAEKFPDVLLGINVKTASGNRLQDARFTDTPGYFFDLSFGKRVFKSEVWAIRLYGMGGFFVYQTNRDDYFQNDAIMWGGGTDVSFNKWTLKAQLTGYSGYFNNLDRPTVGRLELSRKFNQSTLLLRVQQGNDSYPFTSLRLGWQFSFESKN